MNCIISWGVEMGFECSASSSIAWFLSIPVGWSLGHMISWISSFHEERMLRLFDFFIKLTNLLFYLGGGGGKSSRKPNWPKCNPDLVFPCHGIPTHCDASDRPKCDKGFLNLLLPRVVVDATHIYPKIHGHKYFPGKMQVLHLLITATACCLWRYLVCCCWWAKVCFINTILMLT